MGVVLYEKNSLYHNADRYNLLPLHPSLMNLDARGLAPWRGIAYKGHSIIVCVTNVMLVLVLVLVLFSIYALKADLSDGLLPLFSGA